METNTAGRGRLRRWHKFSIFLFVGLILMASGFFIKNEYLWWSSGVVLISSGWFGILSLFELFDKIDSDKS